MGHQVTLGGERLGAGKRQKIELHNYERSTHDLGFVWRSTMSSGTLVPFMSEVALPGDTFDIDLNVDVLTHPTIGPLFGTYKIQLDVFQIPVRLYNADLHMNMLGIGRDMSKVVLPQVYMEADPIDPTANLDNQQINPSCIFSYLGIRGVGQHNTTPTLPTIRNFNAVPYLGYWDIYKNYYANKQEEIGAVIHKNLAAEAVVILTADIDIALPPISIPVDPTPPIVYTNTFLISGSRLVITGTGITDDLDVSQLIFNIKSLNNGEELVVQGTDLFTIWDIYEDTQTIVASAPTYLGKIGLGWGLIQYVPADTTNNYDTEPTIVTFALKEIDDMRLRLLRYVAAPAGAPYPITKDSPVPYSLPLLDNGGVPRTFSKQFSQEGLALKTYQSDLFNNWISTEWIDGPDGISAITAVDTSAGSFTIDELNLSKKIYDMLNRIAVTGGSYDDWLDAVYTHERTRSSENPMYLGGLIRNLVFQEVISNAEASGQPLGTLAGRGTLGHKKKGGKIIAKIDEPSYIMGIVSITPNVDYSQGNKWDTNLLTMNDFHKPALDQIGFQDLITDQMAWFDTKVDNTGAPVVSNVLYKSAGKQPAWTNYMTNVNVVRGNFADQTQQMFMTLNRRYQANWSATEGMSIKDLTTYIDPVKFNHIFADTRRDAQNFWCQIGANIDARRKMSAKVMPNL